MKIELTKEEEIRLSLLEIRYGVTASNLIKRIIKDPHSYLAGEHFDRNQLDDDYSDKEQEKIDQLETKLYEIENAKPVSKEMLDWYDKYAKQQKNDKSLNKSEGKSM